jgi:hypothetical protein
MLRLDKSKVGFLLKNDSFDEEGHEPMMIVVRNTKSTSNNLVSFNI